MDEFGHWEIDSVLGKKNENEPVVIALTERKFRNSIWLKARNHSAEAMDEAIHEMLNRFGDRYNEIFKTITTDNGSEFRNFLFWKQRISVYTSPIHIHPAKKEQ